MTTDNERLATIGQIADRFAENRTAATNLRNAALEELHLLVLVHLGTPGWRIEWGAWGIPSFIPPQPLRGYLEKIIENTAAHEMLSDMADISVAGAYVLSLTKGNVTLELCATELDDIEKTVEDLEKKGLVVDMRPFRKEFKATILEAIEQQRIDLESRRRTVEGW